MLRANMAATNQLLIPAPNGRYAVGYTTSKLIDEARADPYDLDHGKRAVMISAFYPIDRSICKDTITLPYMPLKTAQTLDAGLVYFGLPKMFTTIKMQVAAAAPDDAAKAFGTFPLVLFSPGLTSSRHQYNALAQRIASDGFTVVSMDSAHETTSIEYPDGTHLLGKPLAHWDPQNTERHEELLATRVADARFVLSQLGRLDVVKTFVPGAEQAFDVGKAAIVGHSFGGATAVSALMQDGRFVGALNMDGSQYGPLADTEMPVLLFGRGEPSPRNRANNATWQPLWEHLKGRRWEVNLGESEHLTFCDTPLLVKLSGVEKSGVIVKMVGGLDGERALEIVAAYVVAFLGVVLRGEDGGLLEGRGGRFPEVVHG